MSVFMVAEMSGNHQGSLQQALDILYAAWESGADAVKIQTMDPERMAPPGTVVPNGRWAGRDLRALYRETMLPWQWHQRLFDEGRDLGIEVFSSPFDPSAVAYLQTLGCPRFKVASPEVGDYHLLQAIAATQKPVLISDGLADGPGIDRALAVVGRERATVLRCVSEYPAKPIDFRFGDLRDGPIAIPAWGLSDHSLTTTASIVATTMGATVIEKHLTLSRDHGGADASFSLEPHEFRQTVQVVREAEQMREPPKSLLERKPSTYSWLSRSLWIFRDVRAGEEISLRNVRALRSNLGIDPFSWPLIAGRRFTSDVQAYTPLSRDLVSPTLAATGAMP